MLIRKSMMLVALGALAVAACDNPKNDTTKTEPNPGITTTPAAPQQPVTNTNATLNAPTANNPTAPATNINPIANASNASDVKTFPDQLKVMTAPTRIITTAATVRTAPQASDQVEVAKQGLQVTPVAKERDYFLVLFSDPSDSAKQKAGWVYKDALESEHSSPLTAPANAKTGASAKLTCRAGEAKLATDHEFCGTQCKDDSDCKKVFGVCDGDGKVTSVSGQLTPAHYCVTNSVPGTSEPTMKTP
jgi:hypothetical protein